LNVRNKLIFYGEEMLAPRQTPKLEDHPLSAVGDCLFNIFTAALQNWRASPPITTNPFIHQWLYCPLLGLVPFFSFLILYTVGRTPLMGDQPMARPLLIHRATQTQNTRTQQTSMPSQRFAPIIPAFARAKTVHALHRAANLIDLSNTYRL
jgi:hypothetical protein